MDDTMGVVSEDLFASLRPEFCADVKTKFAALTEMERLEAVLLSRKAQMVASTTEDVARRQVERAR